MKINQNWSGAAWLDLLRISWRTQLQKRAPVRFPLFSNSNFIAQNPPGEFLLDSLCLLHRALTQNCSQHAKRAPARFPLFLIWFLLTKLLKTWQASSCSIFLCFRIRVRIRYCLKLVSRCFEQVCIKILIRKQRKSSRSSPAKFWSIVYLKLWCAWQNLNNSGLGSNYTTKEIEQGLAWHALNNSMLKFELENERFRAGVHLSSFKQFCP